LFTRQYFLQRAVHLKIWACPIMKNQLPIKGYLGHNQEQYENRKLYPLEKVGGQRQLILGKHSGRVDLPHFAARQSLNLNDQQINELLSNTRTNMAFEGKIDDKRIFNEFFENKGVSNALTRGIFALPKLNDLRGHQVELLPDIILSAAHQCMPDFGSQFFLRKRLLYKIHAFLQHSMMGNHVCRIA
jgi:hypothetical protein